MLAAKEMRIRLLSWSKKVQTWTSWWKKIHSPAIATIMVWKTPLSAACWKGNINVVRLLLAAGADIDKTDIHGGSPFLIA